MSVFRTCTKTSGLIFEEDFTTVEDCANLCVNELSSGCLFFSVGDGLCRGCESEPSENDENYTSFIIVNDPSAEPSNSGKAASFCKLTVCRLYDKNAQKAYCKSFKNQHTNYMVYQSRFYNSTQLKKVVFKKILSHKNFGQAFVLAWIPISWKNIFSKRTFLDPLSLLKWNWYFLNFFRLQNQNLHVLEHFKHEKD